MKALIFLAGRGTRLAQVTNNPKCLLEINSKPLIELYLDALSRAGIRDIVLVVGYKKEKIIKFLGGKHKAIKIKYMYNDRYNEGSILSLLCARDYFDDDVITMDGDLIFDERLLRKLINAKSDNFILADFNKKDVKDGMKVAADKSGRVKDINYNIKCSKNDVTAESVGFIKWSKKDAHVFKEAFEFLFKDGKFNDVYEKAVRYLIHNCRCGFRVLRTGGYPWMFINTPSEYAKAKELYLKWNRNKLK